MNLTIVIGSPRANSQSEKVANYLLGVKNISKVFSSISIVSLFQLNLSYGPFELQENLAWQKTSNILKNSNAFVFICPEWDGMASPALKNFFNYCREGELFHKPALLISVSAGYGGSYPIAELRMSSYKNSRVCYLPEHVIIRNANAVLNAPSPSSEQDTSLRARIEYSIDMLSIYSHAFKHISTNVLLENKNFINGM